MYLTFGKNICILTYCVMGMMSRTTVCAPTIYASPKMFIIRRRNEIFGTNLLLHLFRQSLNSVFGCEKITNKANINVKKLNSLNMVLEAKSYV